MLRRFASPRAALPVASHARNAAVRCYSVPPSAPYEVFDRNAKRLQKSRAARNAPESRIVEYLRREAAARTIERLAFITRKFDSVLDFGSGAGIFEQMLTPTGNDGRNSASDLSEVRGRLGKITMLDSCSELLYRDADPAQFPFNRELSIERLVADEETVANGTLPEESFDACISTLSMHWINDLPGVLQGISRVLKPDGMFLASMIGGDSLFELRTSLQLAEMERRGGLSPRMSPLADVNDVGGLLSKARFNLLTVDVEDIVVSFPDLFSLLSDLQAMGESNAVLHRQTGIPRDVLIAADAIYKEMHGEGDSIPATFRVIFMIGWKQSENQPKPLERGSGEVSLKDILKMES